MRFGILSEEELNREVVQCTKAINTAIVGKDFRSMSVGSACLFVAALTMKKAGVPKGEYMRIAEAFFDG